MMNDKKPTTKEMLPYFLLMSAVTIGLALLIQYAAESHGAHPLTALIFLIPITLFLVSLYIFKKGSRRKNKRK